MLIHRHTAKRELSQDIVCYSRLLMSAWKAEELSKHAAYQAACRWALDGESQRQGRAQRKAEQEAIGHVQADVQRLLDRAFDDYRLRATGEEQRPAALVGLWQVFDRDVLRAGGTSKAGL